MAELQTCPDCQGSGMARASSCARCRGTGAIKASEAPAVSREVAREQEEISLEARAAVEKELAEALESPRLRLKNAQLKLSPGGRKGRGLSFKG